jgi:hypothetical protein
MIVSQSKGLSQIPDSVWKRYGVTDPSKLNFEVVPRTDYNGETNQYYETYDLVDKKSGVTLDQGNLGQITGDLSGTLIPDAKGNFTYQVAKADPWSLEGVVSGAAHGLGDIAKDNPMLVSMILNAVAPGLGSVIGESLGLTGTAASMAGGALTGAGTAALTGGDIGRGALMGGIGGGSGTEIGDSGITLGNVANVYKGVEALKSGNPLAIASAAASALSSNQNTGPNSKDFEQGSFPVSGGEQYPQPFSVASSEDQPPASSSKSPLDSILPNAQKIIGGLGTAQKLINAAKSGPLGGISALTQFAKSNTPQASGDKLPTPRVDVSKLFPVSDAPPAYVPPSRLIPLNDFESLNKLLTG